MIGVVVQARMGSSRLPGKVLLPAVGRPLLALLLERLRDCRRPELVVVATSVAPADDAVAEVAAACGALVHRGSETDVLARYDEAARRFALDPVVRITADCPLLDPALVDRMIDCYLATEWAGTPVDLVTNRHPLTFADGLDVDVMRRAALAHAARAARAPHQREHTIPFFWESGMRVLNIEDPERRFERHRWTLDYPEDYEVIRHVYEALHPRDPHFTSADVEAYLAAHPDILQLNARWLPTSGAAV